MTNPFADLDAASGLPDGTLGSVWQQETGCGQNLSTSSAGCKGHFQFGQGTRDEFLAKYGLDAWSHDPRVAAKVAGLYLKELKDKYNGDLPKALAAYNWGPGYVDKAVATYGDKWLAHAPKETRNYVPQILGRINGHFNIPDLGDPNSYGDDDQEIASRRAMLERLGLSEQEVNAMKPAEILGKLFETIFTALLKHALEGQMTNLYVPPPAAGEFVAPAPTPPASLPPSAQPAPAR